MLNETEEEDVRHKRESRDGQLRKNVAASTIAANNRMRL